jgi:hypothetical protein
MTFDAYLPSGPADYMEHVNVTTTYASFSSCDKALESRQCRPETPGDCRQAAWASNDVNRPRQTAHCGCDLIIWHSALVRMTGS